MGIARISINAPDGGVKRFPRPLRSKLDNPFVLANTLAYVSHLVRHDPGLYSETDLIHKICSYGDYEIGPAVELLRIAEETNGIAKLSLAFKLDRYYSKVYVDSFEVLGLSEGL